MLGEEIREGILVDDLGRPLPEDQQKTIPESEALGAPAAPPSINFDNMAPCLFGDAVPLTNWYRSTGARFSAITFRGPSANDGGAIVGECGSWGVTNYSAPSFLAFNCTATMANGGRPVGPETIIFAAPQVGVSLRIGSSHTGQLVEIAAKDAQRKAVVSTQVALAADMPMVLLQGTKKIKKVVISDPEGSAACAFLVDDIHGIAP